MLGQFADELNALEKEYDVEVIHVAMPANKYGNVVTFVALVHCTEKPVKFEVEAGGWG